jgi:hypothetical protein
MQEQEKRLKNIEKLPKKVDMKALNCLIYQKTQNRIKRMIRKIEIHVIQMYNFFLIVALLRDQKFDEEDQQHAPLV